MAKQELIDKILSDAESRAEELRSEAKAKADALLAAAEEERAALIENVRKVAAAAKPDTLKRAKAMAELEVRKVILSRKQAVLQKAYDQAFEVIARDGRYGDLLTKMILSATEEGDRVVFASSDVSRINVKKVMSAIDSGKKGISVSEEQGAFRGGIVLRGEACDKNLTLELELEALRSSGKMKYDTLFK